MLCMEVDPVNENQRQRNRERRREWARNHPEKIKEYRRNQRRRDALIDLLADGDRDKLIEMLKAQADDFMERLNRKMQKHLDEMDPGQAGAPPL